jgi:hypothetical protein
MECRGRSFAGLRAQPENVQAGAVFLENTKFFGAPEAAI